MTGARIQLFGGLRLERAGVECPSPPSRKGRALLAYLLLHAGAPQPREQLAAHFWSESDDRRARQSLRQALSEVRRCIDALGGYVWLDADDHAVTLRVDCPVDVLDFLRDTAPVAERPPPSPLDADQADALDRAASLAAADFLPECYDEWCISVREHLHQRRQRALQAVLDRAEADGDHARVLRVGAMLLAIDPLQEQVHRSMMEAAARAGDRSAALRQYAACAALLDEELGTAPAAETVRLYERIRDGLLGPATPADDGPALVGRETELESIAGAMESAAAGAAQTVMLWGPAGIGKSRLAAEAAARARLEGWRVVEVEAGTGYSRAFGPWTAVLRTLLLDDDGLAASLSMAGLLAVARLIPEAQHLVARTAVNREPTHGDLFADVVAVVRAAAARRPLLVVLDDLHRADRDSVLLFEHVARAGQAAPLVLLGTARDGAQDAADSGIAEMSASLRRDRSLREIALRPLDPIQVRTLLRHLSGNPAMAASLADAVYVETAGNPLHVGEVWRTMREQDRLERDASGRWRWRGGLLGERERLPLPMRVRATIAGRIASLSLAAREALVLGAMIERPWDLDLLSAIADAPAETWADALREAVRHRLLQERDGEFRFAHDVIRETVEREIDESLRRSLHLRIGETLETLYGERWEDHADELARHFVRAGPRGVGRAFAYTRRAADQSKATFAHEHAIKQFELALDYAEGGLVTDRGTLARLRLELAEVLARTGRMSEAQAAGDRALAEAAPEDADLRIELARRLAVLFDANAHPDAVIRYTSAALDLLAAEDGERYASLLQQWAYARERVGNAADLRQAAGTLASVAQRTENERIRLAGLQAEALWRSNYSLDQEACAELRLELSDAYKRLGEPFVALECLADAADSLLRVGEIRRARPLAEAAVAEARRLQGAWAAFQTYPVLAELYLTTGEFAALDDLFEELRPHLAGSAPTGRGIQLVGAKGVADMWRGHPTIDYEELGRHGDPTRWREMRFVARIWACMESGALEEARRLLDQAATLVPYEGTGMRWAVAAVMMVYNYNELECGREADRWYDSLAMHSRFQIPGTQAGLELARTDLLNRRLSAAGRHLTECVARCEAEDMRPFLAQAWVGQGRLALERGDVKQAADLFQRAEATFRDLGMTMWAAHTRALRGGRLRPTA
jgi:DNA-binding SARP family transcriptional activator/tetratricopeptide (TPR) repeat protein